MGDPVCVHTGPNNHSYMYNVEGCVHSDSAIGFPIKSISESLCGTKLPHTCPQLMGVFTDMKAWRDGKGVCGVMKDYWCAQRIGFVSGVGSDYSVGSYTAQYYGLCAIAVV